MIASRKTKDHHRRLGEHYGGPSLVAIKLSGNASRQYRNC